MQKLAEICIKRPVFAAMIILSLVVVGASSYFKLGVDRFPAVDVPTVTVRASLPGASPEEAETTLAQTLEEAVNTVEGIEQLRSVSSQGRAFVMATFGLDRDIDDAAQDVRDRVQGVTRLFPPGTDPPIVQKFDNERQGIMTIALSSNRSVRELSELADNVVRKQLERSSGVGEISVIGGITRSINVWVDADRIAAYRIPITDVRAAVVRQNADVPGGNVDNGRRELSLRTMGRVVDPGLFNDLVIKTIGGAPVRVRDIGYAEDGTKEQRSLSRLTDLTTAGDDPQKRAQTPSVPSVAIEVRRQTGANTMSVIEDVKKNMARVQSQLPSDVRLEIINDQSRYIKNALHEINTHLILGSVLACLVVMLFMRSWRSTIIAGIAIPTSVISTFGMMKALDFTLNSVTMLALVLMVGVVIDDAIVVLENIFRFIEEKKMHPMQAAREATKEIGLAVLATTLSLVVIFLPISFMSSISGRFLYQFGLTSAVAVLVSLLVSFTLTPMMSARLFNFREISGGHQGPKSRSGFYSWIDRFYSAMLGLALRHRPWVVMGAALVMLSSFPLYRMVRQEFTPGNTDEGEFEIGITAPEGTSLTAMDDVVQRIEQELRTLPAVRVMLASIGAGRMGGVNYARVYIRIPPHHERRFAFGRLLSLTPWKAFAGNYSQRDVVQLVRQRLKKFGDIRASIRSNASSISLGGPNFEIDFSILGPDLESLAQYAEQLRRKAPDIGVVDADTTLKLDKPELRVEIDRDRAATLGVSTDDIASALRIMVGGDDRVSRFRDPTVNDDYDVQLRLAEGDRNDPTTISRLYVPRENGGLMRLDNLVKIVPGTTASRIDRLDRQRQVSLRGGIAPGFALADRLEALRAAFKEMNLPSVYTTQISGRGRELERTFKEFLWAFLLSVIFMYMILASQYESLVHPFTILLSLPLSLPFALFSIWVSGNTLNLYSALGLLVLFGVVKKNAILQIDHMNNLRAQGMERWSAILQGNRDRLRPILMTTLTLVAGMIPLAVGSGPGAEERRAVAVVVIGGQTLCLLLTLVVTPVAYSLLDDLREKLHWRALVKHPSTVGKESAVPAK